MHINLFKHSHLGKKRKKKGSFLREIINWSLFTLDEETHIHGFPALVLIHRISNIWYDGTTYDRYYIIGSLKSLVLCGIQNLNYFSNQNL